MRENWQTFNSRKIHYISKGLFFVPFVTVFFILATVVVSEALHYKESCVSYEYRSSKESQVHDDEKCSSTCGHVKFDDSAKGDNITAWYIANAACDYGVHQASAEAVGAWQTNLMWADAWTFTYDVVRIELVDLVYGGDGTAELCIELAGSVSEVLGDGGVSVDLASYWEDSEWAEYIIDYTEYFDADITVQKELCGTFPYKLSDDDDGDGLADGTITIETGFHVAAFVPPVSTKWEEYSGRAKGDFLNTVKIKSIKLPEGHALTSESGYAYPIIHDYGSPGPPVRTETVPTMNEWGMILFMILVGLVSLFYLRRQRN